MYCGIVGRRGDGNFYHLVMAHCVSFQLIIDFLNALVCFGCLPTPALPLFITAFCRTLNIERFCSRSWDVMRNLLGTHLGHCALDCLTKLIYDRYWAEQWVGLRLEVWHSKCFAISLI